MAIDTATLTRPARTARAPRPPRRPFGTWFRQTGWRHLVGIAMLIFSAFPLLYVLSAALNPGGTLLTANGLFQTISVDSFVRLFSLPQQPFAAWFVNSLVIGLVTAAGTVFLGALAAYSFSACASPDADSGSSACCWCRCSRSCWRSWRSSCS